MRKKVKLHRPNSGRRKTLKRPNWRKNHRPTTEKSEGSLGRDVAGEKETAPEGFPGNLREGGGGNQFLMKAEKQKARSTSSRKNAKDAASKYNRGKN